MRKTGRTHTIDVVFVLAVACAFAASILMVLMLGVNIYGGIQQTANEEFNERVSLSYIAAKVHANDEYDAVRVGSFEGSSALFLEKDIYGEEFYTIIYVYDGWIRELTMAKDNELSPESGAPLLEVNSLTFTKIKPNLISVEYLDVNGNTGKLFVNLRSRGGDAA